MYNGVVNEIRKQIDNPTFTQGKALNHMRKHVDNNGHPNTQIHGVLSKNLAHFDDLRNWALPIAPGSGHRSTQSCEGPIAQPALRRGRVAQHLHCGQPHNWRPTPRQHGGRLDTPADPE